MVSYNFEDVHLVPRQLSEVSSRKEIDLSISLDRADKIRLRMPFLPAPMDTVSSVAMCRMFYENGMLGMIHRFQTAEDRLSNYSTLKNEKMDAFISVGLEEQELVEAVYENGAHLFTVDVANGFNKAVEPIIKFIKNLGGTYIIAGNVASKEGFQYLSDLGVDAIRVGIGTGSMCTTSIMTGVGQGIVSALQECKSAQLKTGSGAKIIADGGISNAGDIAKSLAAGADLVMVGRLLAGTKEAEGNILKYNDKLYKPYRGSASFAVQAKSGKNPYYVEGDETIVEYKGSVQNIFDQLEAGLRSAFSYMAAKDCASFQRNAQLEIED
jgi:IMP dehydrogenase